MKTPETTPGPCRRFDSVPSHFLKTSDFRGSVPPDVPFEESDGARHHRKWEVNYRLEAALLVALALVSAVAGLNLWAGSHPAGAIAAALIAKGLLYAAHGSLREARWHASRRKLHAAAAAGVAFFMKQLGGVSKHRGELEDFPEDMRVRQFPRINQS